MPDYATEREAMVERQLKRRGITDERILDAFLIVPREEFVSEEHAHLAYGDHPLPIEFGQTISQPYIVGLMIDAAGIKPGDSVLEVGAGSGYAAAVISRIADRVIAVERQSDLVQIARQRITVSASIMSKSSRATAPRAAVTTLRSTQSSPPRLEAMSHLRWWNSWPPPAASSCRSEIRAECRSWLG